MMWLRTLRENLGLTQEKLAETVGVERSLISKIETGSARPSPTTAIAIAQVLGINWTKFYEDNQKTIGGEGNNNCTSKKQHSETSRRKGNHTR